MAETPNSGSDEVKVRILKEPTPTGIVAWLTSDKPATLIKQIVGIVVASLAVLRFCQSEDLRKKNEADVSVAGIAASAQRDVAVVAASAQVQVASLNVQQQQVSQLVQVVVSPYAEPTAKNEARALLTRMLRETPLDPLPPTLTGAGGTVGSDGARVSEPIGNVSGRGGSRAPNGNVGGSGGADHIMGSTESRPAGSVRPNDPFGLGTVEVAGGPGNFKTILTMDAPTEVSFAKQSSSFPCGAIKEGGRHEAGRLEIPFHLDQNEVFCVHVNQKTKFETTLTPGNQ